MDRNELEKTLNDYEKFKNIIMEILAIKLEEEEIHLKCTDITFDGDDLRVEYIIRLQGKDNLTHHWLSFPYQQYLNYLELKKK